MRDRAAAVIYLNEFTLPRLMWSLARRRQVFLYPGKVVFPPLGRVVKAVAHWARRFPTVADVWEIAPGAEAHWRLCRMYSVNGYILKAAGALDATVPLPRSLDATHPYAYAARKVANNHGATLMEAVKFLEDVRPEGDLVMVGFPPVVEQAYRAITEPPTNIRFDNWTLGWCLPNLLNTLVVALASTVYVLRHTRARPEKPEAFLLGVDVMNSPHRMLTPLDGLGEVMDKVLFVVRSPEAALAYRDAVEAVRGRHIVHMPTGQYSLAQALRRIAETWAECWHIWRDLHRMEPCQYFQTVKLVLARSQFRSFFNRYTLRGFLARDEYNAEHIIRSQELRRINGLSMGMINGNSNTRVRDVHRFIDFDRAYVVGGYSFRHYLADNWLNIESVREVGTPMVSREVIKSAATRPRSGIAVFVKPPLDANRPIPIIRELATRFPDQKVTVNFRQAASHFGGVAEFQAACADLPPNVELDMEDDSFKLILACKYVICTESTLLVEAIHLKAFTFFLDVYPADWVIIYRDFPQVCVSRADELIAHVARIEADPGAYDWQSLGELVPVDDRCVQDILRHDLGLPPLIDQRHGGGLAETSP